jgi:TolB-like protein/class 3 adenylate cyclase/Tfp pilus assembly protein PilF
MAENGFKRKLTAILSADAVDYSRLMGEDEEATVRTLNTYREVLASLIQQHNGRVLDSTGDNLLAEFVSVVDAVQCAVAVQKEIKARNDDLPENRRMQFRIGINLGDVIQEDDRIYGDGVNIAARLEGLSEPGGICISKTAFDHIESKLPYGYEFLGDQTVKNIAKPVGAYRVLMEPRVTVAIKPEQEKPEPGRRKVFLIGAAALLVVAVAAGIWQFNQRQSKRVEAASVEKMAHPLPEKPSIAVLPFTNMSGDQELDYLADAISENIISALSMIPNMLVISRSSTFIYKNKPVKIKQVSEELGVQYVLEGSLVKSGDKLRVTAQLIDALTGHHKWSQRYDKKMEDILNMFDEITHSVCGELNVELMWGEGHRPYYKGTDNFEAWMYFAKAYELYKRTSREDTKKAQELIEQAISIDQDYSYAWSILASTHFQNAQYGWGSSRADSMKKGLECIDKALSLDKANFQAYAAKGVYYIYNKQFDKAIPEMGKALKYAPNNPGVLFWLDIALRRECRFQEALLYGKKALRLSPFAPWFYYSNIGWNYYLMGQHEEAISWFKRMYKMCEKTKSNMTFPHVYLAMGYSDNGQLDKARYHMQKALEYDPKFNLEDRRKQISYKDPAYTEKYIDALRRAGAPEHPPSQ